MMTAKRGSRIAAAVLATVLTVPAAHAADITGAAASVDFGSAPARFDSGRFQSAIASDRPLGALAKENSTLGDASSSFGFAEKSEEAKFFLVGAAYSEALAYLRSGQKEAALKRIGSIEAELIILQAPSPLYTLLTRTKNVVATGRLPDAAALEMLSLFQPFFEEFAKGKGEDRLTLFRAGSWLLDVTLAAAAGNRELLRQPVKLDYFVKEMKRMDAPKGVLQSLEEIAKVTAQKEISDKDVETVLRAVKKIQSTLG